MFDKDLFEALCDKYNVEIVNNSSKVMLSSCGQDVMLTGDTVHNIFNIFTTYSFFYDVEKKRIYIDSDEYTFDNDDILIA